MQDGKPEDPGKICGKLGLETKCTKKKAEIKNRTRYSLVQSEGKYATLTCLYMWTTYVPKSVSF